MLEKEKAMNEKWIKDHPFTFVWMVSTTTFFITGLLMFVLSMFPMPLHIPECLTPILAVSLIGTTFGAVFMFMEWTMS